MPQSARLVWGGHFCPPSLTFSVSQCLSGDRVFRSASIRENPWPLLIFLISANHRNLRLTRSAPLNRRLPHPFAPFAKEPALSAVEGVGYPDCGQRVHRNINRRLFHARTRRDPMHPPLCYENRTKTRPPTTKYPCSPRLSRRLTRRCVKRVGIRKDDHCMLKRPMSPATVDLSWRLAWVMLLTLIICESGWSQTAQITKATIFEQIDTASSLGFVVRIEGTNLNLPEAPRVVLLPSAGITQQDAPVVTATLVTMNFTAPRTYVPLEVTLSYTTGPKSKKLAGTDCAPDVDVKKNYFYVPESQVAKKYGHGISKNFDVIQVSIVNECPLPVLIPLAGVVLNVATPPLHPFSLEHVTSIFSSDRAFSGPRAIFFNIVQGAATVGSAIEPFFAHGFTQGVSILGGGFTQGAATIWKDLSAEQLQNLTSQSFQDTEQIAGSGGSLQKSIFVARTNKKPNPTLKASSDPGKLFQMEVIPVVTASKSP
jgi:hypothetical protein